MHQQRRPRPIIQTPQVSGKQQDMSQVRCVIRTVHVIARLCVVIVRVELVYCMYKVVMHKPVAFVLVSQTKF